MVIEANLANRAGSMTIQRPADDLDPFRCAPRELAGLVRMNPGRKSNGGPGRRDVGRTRGFPLVSGGEDAQCGRESRRLRPRDNRGQIAGEFFAGQMTMRIDHRTRVPGGIS